MEAILRAMLFALTILSGAPVTSFTGSYEDGVKATKRSDQAAVLEIIRSLAEAADARGQNNLCRMSASGRRVMQDNDESVR